MVPKRHGYYKTLTVNQYRSINTFEQVSNGFVMGPNSEKNVNMESSVPFLTPDTHPVLKRVDPVQVSLFRKDRERYEQEFSEKRKELPTLTLPPYTSCIDRTVHLSLIHI